MDKELRKKLVAKFEGEGGFDSTYSSQNRAWFIGKILDQVAKTAADNAIEAKARGIIKDANARVKSDRNFTVGVTLDPKLEAIERKNVTVRVETIYGVIAENNELAETKFDSLRQFVVRRRYRGVVRMIYQVNPNSNGFLRYPKKCPQLAMRLNDDAHPNWIAVSTQSKVPLRVVDQGDPETAVELIFARAFPDVVPEPPIPPACKGNLLDCGNGTGVVLMDTLLEAADADNLLKKINARGPRHLLVINPTLRLGTGQGDPHFLFENDNESKKLFSKQLVAEEDLQIGDHVFLVNHGLYANVAPNDDWAGEHALVTQCGNRKPANGNGFLFSGHGLNSPTTVEALYDDLIKYLQSYLHRVSKIAEMFFTFRKSANTIPEAEREFQLVALPPALGQGDFHAHLFKKKVIVFNNYTKQSGGAKPPTLTDGGADLPLIIFEIPGKTNEHKILIAPTTEKNTIVKQQKLMNKMTMLVRKGDPAAGGSPYEKTLWQVPYLDTETLTQKFFPLFGGPQGAFKMPERSDMPKKKFGRRKAADNGADVTRPTSDTTPTYVQFLRSIGAIA